MTNRLYNAIISATLIAAGSQAVMADSFGYCDGTVKRTLTFRSGSSETQGLAIRLSHEKLVALKGRTITGVEAAFGSSRTTGSSAEIFLATSLEGEPFMKQTVSITGAAKWLSFSLDEPYVITGNEEALYVGYTAEIATTATLLMADAAATFDGCGFALTDGSWTDILPLGKGNASLRLTLADDAPITDLMLKPVNIDGFFLAGETPKLGAEVFNFGTQTVNSLAVEVTLGDNDPVRLDYKGVEIAQSQKLAIEFPEVANDRSDLYDLSIRVVDVNGGDDDDSSDNVRSGSIFFYPSDIERSVLLEGFTGQDCHNCPSGHSTINSFIESLGAGNNIIEVMHHAGYQPDHMTMESDLDYTYFYGSSSTYAPAVMVNRRQATGMSFPVMNTNTPNLTLAYNEAMSSQPYLSLCLETTYDESTRKAAVKVSTFNHCDLPEGVNVINLMLVQDNIIDSQSPYGAGYRHDAVMRGTLTGNSWGMQLDGNATKRNGGASWSTEFILPEAIFSDYWTNRTLVEDKEVYNIPVVASDMKIVAYVAAHGSTPNSCPVYNAVEARLGESYSQAAFSGIEEVLVGKADCDIRVIDGKITVNGDFDSLAVYSIDGKRIDANSRLAGGLYIVRLQCGSSVITKKLLVK